jgi:3-hydroxybutyryl-CoA dehydrogenase
MQIAVICNEAQKAELMSGGLEESAAVWMEDWQNLPTADAVIDLLFQAVPERIEALRKSPLTIINNVAATLADSEPSFVRINGWNTFLKGSIVEATSNEESKAAATKALAQFNKTVEWLPDEPGFVTPRVISMIINEAYFALSESGSTKEEIDTAMKLGTAYPFGPFEWSQHIGLSNIAQLLSTLGKEVRYLPCPLLLQEAAI